MANTKIGARLECVTSDGIVAGADAIYDDELSMSQKDINATLMGAAFIEEKNNAVSDTDEVFLKDKEGNRVLPVTRTSAVQDGEGTSLSTILASMQEGIEAAGNRGAVEGLKVGFSGSTLSPAGGIITIPTYTEGAQPHIPPTSAEVKSALETGVADGTYLAKDGTWSTPHDTVYESKEAEDGGTDVSLVSTGEKYTWNNKAEKSEMGIVGGTGEDADKATITLKTGASVTVLTSHQDISGKADLDKNGKIVSSQLPSYVDDVIEGYLLDGLFYEEAAHETAITGEAGKIYINLYNNKSYRWSGSAYTEIASSDISGIKVGSSGDIISPSQGVITIPSYEEGAQVHIAPTATEVKSALGTGSGTSKYLREDGTWQVPASSNTTYGLSVGAGDDANKIVLTPSSGTADKITVPYATNAGTVNGKTVAENVPAGAKFSDTTYESEVAENGGTAVSLVTTGEKYVWNNKQDVLTFNSAPSSSNKVATMADIPDSLPANGGNSATVNNHTVAKDVPSDAVFTDHNTTYQFEQDGNTLKMGTDGGMKSPIYTPTGMVYSTMGASGNSHAGGLVPDTPATAGTTKFLREDGRWEEPAGGSSSNRNYVPSDFSGMGYQILERNIQSISGTNKNILTQDMFCKGEVGSRVPNTNTVFVVQYDFDLNGQSITIPDNSVLKLDGGTLCNGTIVCVNTFIDGKHGFKKDITLSGEIRGNAAQFDWFVNEVVSMADYDTFLANGYLTGSMPAISDTNRTILTMLYGVVKTIEFGKGIYPFDAQLDMLPSIKGQGIHDTLLWAPSTDMFHCVSIGSMEARIENLSIESDGYVIYIGNSTQYTLSHHHIAIDDARLVSYSQDCMYKPVASSNLVVYDMNVTKTIMACGPDKVIVNGFDSSSNEFHDCSDSNWFFDTGVVNNKRGKSTAFFKNTSLQKCDGFNVVYKGFKYFVVITSDAIVMNITDNNFEYTPSDAQNLQYLVYFDGGNNNRIRLMNNNFIGSPTGSYHIYGNSMIQNLSIDADIDIYVYNCNLRVSSVSGKVYCITTPLDSGGKKRRLYVAEPGSNYADSSLSPTKDDFTSANDISSLYGFPTFMKNEFTTHLSDGSYTDFYLTVRAPKDRVFYHPKRLCLIKWNSTGSDLEELKSASTYSGIAYSVNTASVSGNVSLDGTIPLHVLTVTGNVSSVTLSANPEAGHSCHVIFYATSAYTVEITHDSTNRVCPGGTNPSPLEILAGGYVEIDFLNAGGKVFVRGF